MTTGEQQKLLGKWRIPSMELWAASFIDLLGPGYTRYDKLANNFASAVAIAATIICWR